MFAGAKQPQLADVLAEDRAFPRTHGVVFDDVLEVVDAFIQPAPVEPVMVQFAFEFGEVPNGVVIALRFPAASFLVSGVAKVFDGPVDNPAAAAVALCIEQAGGCCKENCAKVASCDHGEIVPESNAAGQGAAALLVD